MSKSEFVKAYTWYTGCTRKDAEVAYKTLSDTTKRLYIEAFMDNAKRCILQD